MKLNYGPHLICEKCGSPMEDAFAGGNPDAEDHFCGVCDDFRGGRVKNSKSTD